MRHPFYFPDRIHYGSPADAGLAFESVHFQSKDDTLLHGWLIAAESGLNKARGTVLHCHGNAQNMSAHWPYAAWLTARDYNVLCFDYRGFGQSHGQADEEGIFDDTIAALDYLRTRQNTRSDLSALPLYVFGQSLGGMLAIAASAASPKSISAVAAEAPAYDYSTWAEDLLPAQNHAFDDRFCASHHIRNLTSIPLLLLHSPEDRVVPYTHSVQLLAEANTTKQLITIEGGTHNDAMTDRHGTLYQDLLVDFFEKHRPAR